MLTDAPCVPSYEPIVYMFKAGLRKSRLTPDLRRVYLYLWLTITFFLKYILSWIDDDNMTSYSLATKQALNDDWFRGQHNGMSPRGIIVAQGRRPRATMIPRGDILNSSNFILFNIYKIHKKIKQHSVNIKNYTAHPMTWCTYLQSFEKIHLCVFELQCEN